MEHRATVAQGLHAIDERAQYDAACKRILSEKVILARIMKACLAEYQDCDVDDIAEKYIEGSPHVSDMPVLPDEVDIISGLDTEDKSLHEGMITYDIRFRAIVPGSQQRIGLIINVEAQNDFYPGYPIIKRGIYYCSRMISSQYGVEFTDSHYEKIKKVYSIWVCADPPKYRENTITRYIIHEENLIGEVSEKRENYDLLTAVIICLGHCEDKKYAGVLKLLGVLLSSVEAPSEKKKILQEEFDIKMTRELESEVSKMCNLSKGVWERGMRKGMEEGMKEGRKEGVKEGILASVQNLMESMGWSVEQAMQALKIPEAEQPIYRDNLRIVK